jgi:hypothetical protein
MIVICPNRHLRIGGRKGLGPVLLGRLIKELETSGVVEIEVFLARLYGGAAASRNSGRGPKGSPEEAAGSQPRLPLGSLQRGSRRAAREVARPAGASQ